jgi:hypothetical protein
LHLLVAGKAERVSPRIEVHGCGDVCGCMSVVESSVCRVNPRKCRLVLLCVQVLSSKVLQQFDIVERAIEAMLLKLNKRSVTRS